MLRLGPESREHRSSWHPRAKSPQRPLQKEVPGEPLGASPILSAFHLLKRASPCQFEQSEQGETKESPSAGRSRSRFSLGSSLLFAVSCFVFTAFLKFIFIFSKQTRILGTTVWLADCGQVGSEAGLSSDLLGVILA